MTVGPALISNVDTRGVVRLSLNRPDRRNALSAQLVADLRDVLLRAASDPTIRVVVIQSRGDTFCSGADLSWLRSLADGHAHTLELENLAELLSDVWHFPKPTLARVQGAVYGGGLGLVACCDIVIACANVRLALPELQLGLIPAVILKYLVHALGSRQVRRLCLSGEALSGTEAVRLGIVHKLVMHGELDAEVERQIDMLLRAAPGAVSVFKRLLVEQTESNAVGNNGVAALTKHLHESSEVHEGIAAFFERRRPEWDQ